MTTPTNNTNLFPPYFWGALITIHNHLFNIYTKNHLIDGPEPEATLAEAFRTMDCWLDVAIAAELHKRKR